MIKMPSSRTGLYERTIEPLMGTLNRRTSILLLSVLLTFSLVAWYRSAYGSPAPLLYSDYGAYGRKRGFDGTWNYQRDAENLMLDSQQCDQAFPGLFEEVDRPVNERTHTPITVEEIDAIPKQNGYVRAMIYNQQLYIIDKAGGIYSREIATLHALHRAILTSPEPLPNIEFAFNTDDRIPSVPLWGYARRAEDTHIWLIPDFGYWSWPETKVGSMREVQMKAALTEEYGGWTWTQKVRKILWRGATMGLELREKFIQVTADKAWADVKALDWHDKESMAHDLKSMAEHCQYKYLAHTEGNSYSGRLKYLQACRSVVVAHTMDWIQHHHPLMRSSGPQQNYLQVSRSFDDLEEKISWLEAHDAEAQRIAANSVKTFREQYLTPAAEACYWRKVIHGWAKVSFEPDFFKVVNGSAVWRGLPVESYLLERRLDWDPY
ncbi:hypothetical protein PV04_06802 [Phialophora macrospora]|uniref:Glycosyl transferase CAP10 domain-containing protein n=1 Tax=Phialophora macrospora TaxID=1851006 RepID=A0A0D2FHQ1_9EURO|nr:hypothetical protein PV04_06802 [Phialophora macrospora]